MPPKNTSTTAILTHLEKVIANTKDRALAIKIKLKAIKRGWLKTPM